ncbi:hypothetical protein OH77DRAFT_1422721 [Trametes cingulata]|nr:hypothetical protein OH77DRAFT_1422721 [Trametes cingulata]
MRRPCICVADSPAQTYSQGTPQIPSAPPITRSLAFRGGRCVPGATSCSRGRNGMTCPTCGPEAVDVTAMHMPP